MPDLRSILVSLLLLVETLIAVPIFAISWLVSAIGFAVVGGWQFAKLKSNADKRNILTILLGGKADA